MTLSPVYPILTSRLALRPLVESDTDALLAYRSLPEVCRYVPFEPMTAADIARLLAGRWARQTLDDAGQSLTLGVETRDDGGLIGDVMLFWHSREHRGGEIGYVFNPAVAGHGFATEAVNALLELAFDGLGLRRVVARLDALTRLRRGSLLGSA